MLPHYDLSTDSDQVLIDACRNWGFFELSGHSVGEDLMAEALAVTRKFFNQPQAVKNQIQRTADNCWGFYDSELTKNRRDLKEILDIGPDQDSGPLAGARAQWPDDAHFVGVISELMLAMHDTALEVVSRVMQTLQTDADVLAPFADHSSFLRLNYYPHSDNPAAADTPWLPEEGELGIHHHSDAGAVTVLLQDEVPGLQVHQGDAWHTVPGERSRIIINIGDIVQVWSNDEYKAPLHRVLASQGRERISIPYFLNPDYHYSYAPLGTEVPRYRAINWGEFRSRRSQGDYADVGEEVQISDYRL